MIKAPRLTLSECRRSSGYVAGMYIAMAATLVMAFPLVVLPMRSSLESMLSRCLGDLGPLL